MSLRRSREPRGKPWISCCKAVATTLAASSWLLEANAKTKDATSYVSALTRPPGRKRKTRVLRFLGAFGVSEEASWWNSGFFSDIELATDAWNLSRGL